VCALHARLVTYLIVIDSSSTPPLSDAERIRQLEQQLRWAELKIQVLEERLRLQLIAKYGPASEKLSDAQLQLLELEPGVSQREVQAESEREPLPKTSNNQPNRRHPGCSSCRRICRGWRK
jgi:hypothetical protein